jgi:hypothetical protein
MMPTDVYKGGVHPGRPDGHGTGTDCEIAGADFESIQHSLRSNRRTHEGPDRSRHPAFAGGESVMLHKDWTPEACA